MNTIKSNLAFKAKLNYAEIKSNHSRWSKIAKIFEEKTAKQPNDTFNLASYDKYNKGLEFWTSINNKHSDALNNGHITPFLMNWLLCLSDNMIAEKLKKIFLIQKTVDKMELATLSFQKKFNFFKNVSESLIEQHYNKILDVKDDYVKNMLAKDDILKTKDVISF